MWKKAAASIFPLGMLFCPALSNIAHARADEALPDLNQTTLSGDWNGQRKTWLEQGINLDFTHRSDVIRNAQGGVATGTKWLFYTDARLRFDLGKLWGWDGWTAYGQYHSELGGKPNSQKVGGFIGVDNIEVKTNTAQFSQLWLEKTAMDERLSVLLGLYALDAEFYVTDSSSVFMHPAMGMNISFGQTGKYGPAIFPMTAFGTRLRYRSADKANYLQLAVLDGVPGDPANPRGTHVKFAKGDGIVAMAEFGHLGELPDNAARLINKTAFGAWGYSANVEELGSFPAGSKPPRRRNFGWYVLHERTLMAEAGHPGQGLAGFIRLGTAQADVNQSDWSVNAGLSYTGLFDGRDDDIAGIGMTYAHTSKKYRELNQANGNEAVIEATYRMQVRPWLAVQPLLQYINHPNMDKKLQSAWVVGTRFEVAF